MTILLSPAKNLDFKSDYKVPTTTSVNFLDESEELMTALKGMSAMKLSKLMKLSPKLADLNYERNQNWTNKHTENNSRPALLAFNGAVFLGMDAKEFNGVELKRAQKTIRIISGLYGLLKPLDRIQPYRLEMGSKLKIGKANTLYQFWGNKITEALNKEITDDDFVINLASKEYFSAIKKHDLKGRLITCHFKDKNKFGEYRNVMTYAKTARGLMAKYIIKNNIKTMLGLKKFNLAGYGYNSLQTDEQNLVFTR